MVSAEPTIRLADLGDELPLHNPTDAGCSCERGADCPTPGKHPRIRGWEAHATQPHEPAAWSRQWPDRNVGVHPAAGMLVIDVDDAAAFSEWLAGRELPPTLTAITGRGLHLWLRVPIGRTFRRPPGTDLRSRGTGQVVVPPSRHPSGSVYRWQEPVLPVAEAPAWLVDALSAPRTAETGAGPTRGCQASCRRPSGTR